MSTPGGIVDAKVQHLVSVVERHRDEECSRAREAAREEARKLVAAAWGEAHARMHRDNAETRRRVQRTLDSADAQRQTARREQYQARNQALLADARKALHVELVRRWQRPESRELWCRQLVKQAATILQGKLWTVEHPAEWVESEREALAAHIVELCGEVPQLQTDTDISAGLRICTGGTCVDGTVAGLLRDRERIDAELLALCAVCAGEVT
jgi:vacuolar-type H+-ATPase subunit E/Vma4